MENWMWFDKVAPKQNIQADGLPRMRKWRKFGLLITLILGSIFTPPDPFTMILVAIPLMGLYELSILISAYSERKRDREMKAALE